MSFIDAWRHTRQNTTLGRYLRGPAIIKAEREREAGAAHTISEIKICIPVVKGRAPSSSRGTLWLAARGSAPTPLSSCKWFHKLVIHSSGQPRSKLEKTRWCFSPRENQMSIICARVYLCEMLKSFLCAPLHSPQPDPDWPNSLLKNQMKFERYWELR